MTMTLAVRLPYLAKGNELLVRGSLVGGVVGDTHSDFSNPNRYLKL